MLYAENGVVMLCCLLTKGDEMSDAVEQKIISMLDALQSGVVDIAGKAVKYTPDVINAVDAVIRIDGVQGIVWGVLGICIGVPSIYLGLKYEKDTGGGSVGLGILAGLPALFVGANYLLDVWTWVMVFEPKLYVAHKIVEGVMK